jgi:mitochondrial fission protein ELM1
MKAYPIPMCNGAKRALVWILLGNRQGDNNQLLALAKALGLPFEAKQLTFNRLQHIAFLRGKRLGYLTAAAKRALNPPWPDLVIGLGYDSVPVARHIRDMSGGQTRLVHIGNPRTDISDIDLVITTPQYSLGPATNVLPLPFPIGNPASGIAPTVDEADWLSAFPRPRRLIAVGGSTRQWRLDVAVLSHVVHHLQAEACRRGGSVIAVTSRRTPRPVFNKLKRQLAGEHEVCVENFPRFGMLLAAADECYVTADSVSMLAEAILTGKPVGMIPIARSWRGKLGHAIRQYVWDIPAHADLTAFWRYLSDNRLVGTVASPTSSKVADTVEAAASAVRSILGASRRERRSTSA